MAKLELLSESDPRIREFRNKQKGLLPYFNKLLQDDADYHFDGESPVLVESLGRFYLLHNQDVDITIP